MQIDTWLSYEWLPGTSGAMGCSESFASNFRESKPMAIFSVLFSQRLPSFMLQSFLFCCLGNGNPTGGFEGLALFRIALV